MNEDNFSNQPESKPERDPLYEDLWLKNEAKGHLEVPDPELLDLLVQLENLHLELTAGRRSEGITEEEQKRILTLRHQIRQRKDDLGFNPYH